MELGSLSNVDPRSVWPHEALDFTPWLLDNASVLADALGVDLELSASEHPVGGYSLDLVGRDVTNDCVLIVENQLAGTDHSHLGQLLTYAAGTEAATIVWIATSFREEHRQALDWLNGLAGEGARFFGIELAAVRIGNSAVAPLLRLRAQPNDWHAQIAAAAKSSTTGGKAELYRRFWELFLQRVKTERPGWTKAKTPPGENWLSMPSPVKGALYSAVLGANQQLRYELYIDTGNKELNAAIFWALHNHREAIEGRFGASLSWEEKPERRACRVAAYGGGDVTEIEAHDSHVTWFLTIGNAFRDALSIAVADANAAATSAPSPHDD